MRGRDTEEPPLRRFQDVIPICTQSLDFAAVYVTAALCLAIISQPTKKRKSAWRCAQNVHKAYGEDSFRTPAQVGASPAGFHLR